MFEDLIGICIQQNPQNGEFVYMNIFKRVTCGGWLSKCCIVRKGVRKPGANRIRTRELFDTKRDATQYANNEPRDVMRTT